MILFKLILLVFIIRKVTSFESNLKTCRSNLSIDDVRQVLPSPNPQQWNVISINGNRHVLNKIPIFKTISTLNYDVSILTPYLYLSFSLPNTFTVYWIKYEEGKADVSQYFSFNFLRRIATVGEVTKGTNDKKCLNLYNVAMDLVSVEVNTFSLLICIQENAQIKYNQPMGNLTSNQVVLTFCEAFHTSVTSNLCNGWMGFSEVFRTVLGGYINETITLDLITSDWYRCREEEFNGKTFDYAPDFFEPDYNMMISIGLVCSFIVLAAVFLVIMNKKHIIE